MGVRVQCRSGLLGDRCLELRRGLMHCHEGKQGNAPGGVPALWPECRFSLIGRGGGGLASAGRDDSLVESVRKRQAVW